MLAGPVTESVQIQYERKEHHILNSRSEYNRCSLPRICTQIGEGQYKNYNKELEAEKKEDEKIESKIRALRKEKNKARLHPTKENGPSTKRRRTNNQEYIKIKEIWGEPSLSEQVKRKENNTPEKDMKRKRIDSPTRDEKSHEVNQSKTSNPGKSEDLGNNSRPTTQNHASLCEPKSTMADYVVKTIVDSVLEHIIVHQITTTKSMEPVYCQISPFVLTCVWQKQE